jgi:hypothetical protein
MNEAKIFHTKILKLLLKQKKKAPLLLHYSKKWFEAKKAAPTWISPETSPETSEHFFYTIEAS